jgi:hypothetical protein
LPHSTLPVSRRAASTRSAQSRDGTSRGREAFVTVDADLADLRRAMVELQTTKAGAVSRAVPPWMFWAELVLELARSQGRGNPLVGLSLAMRLLATAKGKSRPAHTDLVAQLRDKLTAM